MRLSIVSTQRWHASRPHKAPSAATCLTKIPALQHLGGSRCQRTRKKLAAKAIVCCFYSRHGVVRQIARPYCTGHRYQALPANLSPPTDRRLNGRICRAAAPHSGVRNAPLVNCMSRLTWCISLAIAIHGRRSTMTAYHCSTIRDHAPPSSLLDSDGVCCFITISIRPLQVFLLPSTEPFTSSPRLTFAETSAFSSTANSFVLSNQYGSRDSKSSATGAMAGFRDRYSISAGCVSFGLPQRRYERH